LISRATCPDQQILRTTVAGLPTAPRLPAPVLLIAGEVAACAIHSVAPDSNLPDKTLGYPKAFASGAKAPF
jgi:siroheme synthase